MRISEKLKTGLTNAEKIRCYKKVLSKFKRNTSCGICFHLLMLFQDCLIYENYLDIYKLFPEFYAKKPKHIHHSDYWFKDNEERIQVLNELIAELS